jgi:hypothetical protein
MSHNPGDAATTARAPEEEQTQTSTDEQNTQGAQSAIAQHPTGNTANAVAESPAEAGQATGTEGQSSRSESFANNPSTNPQASAAETRNETFQALAGGGQPQTANEQSPSAQPEQSNAQGNTQGNTPNASAQSSAQPSAQSPATASPSPVESSQAATPQPTGERDEGVANSANVNATSSASSAEEATRREFAPRPDVSDQNWQELVPKLLGLFNNNREQLARALGLHRSTVDRWLNGKSKPNTSTILRMRRLAQERQVE